MQIRCGGARNLVRYVPNPVFCKYPADNSDFVSPALLFLMGVLLTLNMSVATQRVVSNFPTCGEAKYWSYKLSWFAFIEDLDAFPVLYKFHDENLATLGQSLGFTLAPSQL
jgi:hypothetical protein